MEREIYNKLLEWKSTPGHGPLLLTGAPMVGKTYIVKEFGKREFTKVARFSFLDQPIVRTIFRNQPEVTKILLRLSSLFRRDIVPGQTLLILDDIQYCPDALELLSDFRDDAPSLDLIACGTFSDLSVVPDSIARISLHPFTFNEFLLATGQKYLAGKLQNRQWDSVRALAPKLEDYLRQYLFCGGMPSVVSAFADNSGPAEVRQMQLDMLQSLESRLSKRQLDVWNASFVALTAENHKFMYASVRKGARQAEYSQSVDNLVNMGLLSRITKVTQVSQPLGFYEDAASFVLYPADVGLTGAKLGVDPSVFLLGEEAFSGFCGAFPRLMVAQQLCTSDFPTHYYARTGSLIAMDFIIQTRAMIVAVEVNARPTGNDKALKTFMAKHPGRRGIRISLEVHSTASWMENIPLYAAGGFLSSL